MLNIPNVPKIGAQTSAASAAAMATVANDPPARTDLYKMRLTQPIRTHNGERNELSLRKPVGADYIEIGRVPFDVRGVGEDRRVVIDFQIAARWAAKLTGLDEIIIGNLCAEDWLNLVSRLNAILVNLGNNDAGN